MATRRGLGRGLGALIRDGRTPQKKKKKQEKTPTAAKRAKPKAPSTSKPSNDGILQIPVDKIRKNRWQPRKDFDPEALADLAASIRKRGLLQPLLVRAAGKTYELIAGERRLRAAGKVGLTTVPVIVMDATDADTAELALVENLQREDLNVIEEAEGYQALASRFDLTQEQIADRVGKARASVANALRLLSLPEDVKQLLLDGDLSTGHAKLLTGLEIGPEQSLLAKRTATEGISVRELEKLVKKAKLPPRKPRTARSDIPTNHLRYLTDKLHGFFGTAVRVTPCRTYANGKKGKGSIEIDYFSNDELDRLLELLGLTDE